MISSRFFARLHPASHRVTLIPRLTDCELQLDERSRGGFVSGTLTAGCQPVIHPANQQACRPAWLVAAAAAAVRRVTQTTGEDDSDEDETCDLSIK